MLSLTRARSVLRAMGLLMISFSLAACVGEKAAETDTEPEPEPDPAPISIDVRRSLMITDLDILKPFTFRRVMTALAGAGDKPSPAAALDLFHQWWDTQNDASKAVGSGAHCDSETMAGEPAMNGYPLFCPRAEGGLASADPFEESLPGGEINPDHFFPIGLANRFDLARIDGTSCGEYRVLFAKRSRPDKAPGDRTLVIFEAGLPNPQPDLGLEGCRPVAQFIADLSTLSAAERAEELERFYFEGLDGFEPVISPSHYDGILGHVRSNQFVDAAAEAWTLKDFMVVSDSGGARIAPLPVVDSPFVELFDTTSANPKAAAFRDYFLTQVDSLAIDDMNRFFMTTPLQFLPGESVSSPAGPGAQPPPQPGDPPPVLDDTLRGDYLRAFTTGAETDDSFRIALQDKLTAIGSKLTPDDIVKRAMTRSCAGCHEINGGGAVIIGGGPGGNAGNTADTRDLGGGLLWPRPLGFVHVSEEDLFREPAQDAGIRYGISNALKDLFLPHRKEVLERFLAGVERPSGAVGDGTLGSL
jgi:hypothetical protein